MNITPIKKYDMAERVAIHGLNYPEIRAFRPAAFSQVNFPLNVTNEHDLQRYCDILHELEDIDFYLNVEQYSDDEALLINLTADKVAKLTKRLFKKSTRPYIGLFSPIYIFRIIKKFPKSTSILEIGPGSGFLGSYCIQSGFKYKSTDITQALYLLLS